MICPKCVGRELADIWLRRERDEARAGLKRQRSPLLLQVRDAKDELAQFFKQEIEKLRGERNYFEEQAYLYRDSRDRGILEIKRLTEEVERLRRGERWTDDD